MTKTNFSDLNVTLIQSDLHWENAAANRQMFGEKIAAINEETDIIVLPEMFTTGFSMAAEKLAESPDGETVKWMKKQAAQMGAVVTGSIIVKEGGQYFNRLFWAAPNGNISHYDKRHLFSLGGEEKVYSSGNDKVVFEWKGWRICPLICYDLRFPVWCRNKEEYDLLLFIASWPDKRIYAWKQLMIARAIENQSYVIGVNRVGMDGNGILHTGGSMIIDPIGEVLFSKDDEEIVKIHRFEMGIITSCRTKLPFLSDADGFVIN